MMRSIAGVVLAGGRSTRMGAEKALLPLAGRPLLAHVVQRLRPQVDALFVNANGDLARFAGFDLAVIADAAPAPDAGPLAGVAAALRAAQSRGYALLATAPCDAPFLPLDLVARLAVAMAESGAPVAVAESPNGLEPLFALWRVDLADQAEAAQRAGEGGPRGLLARLGAAPARFIEDEPFANLNTPEDLAAAQARLGPSAAQRDAL